MAAHRVGRLQPHRASGKGWRRCGQWSGAVAAAASTAATGGACAPPQTVQYKTVAEAGTEHVVLEQCAAARSTAAQRQR